MTLRRRLYLTLDPNAKGGLTETIFEVFLITTIILNILAIVLDSVPVIHESYQDAFEYFEGFSVIFFSMEYLARVYSIVEDPKFSRSVNGRIKYLLTPLAIVDLMAFMPFYISRLSVDLRLLRIFRLMSVFRMFKIVRYLHALNIFKR